MQQTITGIYLNHTNYGDTSIILKLYTLQYGTTSFIVKGIKRKKGGVAALQPFHFLELVSNFKPDKELNFGNQVKLSKPSYSLTSDVRKSTVALFLTEVLNKTLKEAAPGEEKYEIIASLIDYYDHAEFSSIFHHYFIIKLINLLGLFPNFGYNKSIDLLNIRKGQFEYTPQPDSNYFSIETSNAFKLISGTNFDELNSLNIDKKTKKQLLSDLVNYLEIQTEIGRGSVRSYKILEAVFS